MGGATFEQKLVHLLNEQKILQDRENEYDEYWSNGVYERYKYPILTAEHVPLSWRYDLDPATNPFLMERLGVRATFHPGAIEIGCTVYLVARVQADGKSFFAVVQSDTGIDQFRFWEYPLILPPAAEPETDVYDMRVVRHEDGWIYGLFGVERPGRRVCCGIARTKNLKEWERLGDLETDFPAVLHPEFVDGHYAFYTRTADGIGLGLSKGIERAAVQKESVLGVPASLRDMGPTPIKTPEGWLHLVQGSDQSLHVFLCDLARPEKVRCRPEGSFLKPVGEEQTGAVMNRIGCNGWVARPDGQILIYYSSAQSRIHVATTSVAKMVDYVMHTPPEPERSEGCVEQRIALIRKNAELKKTRPDYFTETL